MFFSLAFIKSCSISLLYSLKSWYWEPYTPWYLLLDKKNDSISFFSLSVFHSSFLSLFLSFTLHMSRKSWSSFIFHLSHRLTSCGSWKLGFLFLILCPHLNILNLINCSMKKMSFWKKRRIYINSRAYIFLVSQGTYLLWLVSCETDHQWKVRMNDLVITVWFRELLPMKPVWIQQAVFSLLNKCILRADSAKNRGRGGRNWILLPSGLQRATNLE